MNTTIEEIILAGYLHDVGKFAQRAGVESLYDKNFETDCCKHHPSGWYSHQHAVYTEGFINKYATVFPCNVDTIRRLASHHHNPSEFAEWIISVADCLSSGSDRCNILGELEAKDEDSANEEKLKFYEKPMIHLLSTLNIDNRPGAEISYCKMQPLEENTVLATSDKKIGKEDYKRLWIQFETDFSKLGGLDFEQFIKALQSLLERYWWCIPSATNVDSDISLFQHAKTTAAFAVCLYRYYENLQEDIVSLKNNNEKKFLFINGDLSGIQKYIFDLKTSSDSSKLLRAKSFQLWALSEILAEYICKEFGVFESNIITSAGGKFLVMVPNVKNSKEKLEKIQTEIETYFMKEFAGKLSVIISEGFEASAADLQSEVVKRLFDKIGYTADCSKQKKMQKAVLKNGAILEGFYENLQKNGECPKCGIFAANPNNDGNECDNCKKLTDIGRGLVKGSVVELDSDKLRHFGQMIKVYGSDGKSRANCYQVNNYKAGKPVMFLPYTAPLKDEDTKELLTFEEIAECASGNKKLAMFKADIDNLGLVFSSSLGKRKSISRYADLSFMLHYFFSAFYTWFVKNNRDSDGNYYEDVIYTVFSGGDDLCVLGAWDSVLYFARDFQRALCKFTNNNPSITISGGISLSSPNIPVNIMADMAEENLENSKAYAKDGKLKNAITVFGTTVNWNEYSACLKDGEWLDSMLEENQLTTGVVYKMIDFANRAKEIRGGKLNPKNLTWKSNFNYIIARNVKDATIKNKMLAFAVDDDKMINSKIAVSYALYKNRNNAMEE